MGTATTLTALKSRHREYVDGRSLPRTVAGSKADMLLQVARSLPQPFLWSRLVVEAWRRHPREFGLKGYSDLYPDSNRVSAVLYGEKGLIRRGVERVRAGLFRVRCAMRDCKHGQRTEECAVCRSEK